MAVDDFGTEVLKKAAEYTYPPDGDGNPDKSDYYLKFIEDDNRKKIVDVQNSILTFIGYTKDSDTTTDEAKWQIQRQVTQGGVTTTIFADDGKYTQVWDDRESLFPAVPFDNPASLLFSGSSDYIDCGDNYTFGPATAFSWSFWMKAQNFSAQRAMIAKTSHDANVYGYSLQHNSSGKLFAQMRAPSTLRNLTYSTVMSAGTWYHICFTYAGGSNVNGMLAYIDGVVEPTPSSASLNAWTTTDPLTFGARSTSTFFFSGNLNNISVWDKALSSAEVSEIYNSGQPADLSEHSAVANLQSWWLLNTSANFPTEVDQQVAAVDGTLMNMSAGDYDTGDVP